MNQICISNINEYTLQEVFNASVTHLLTQNAKSMLPKEKRTNSGANCAYRGENGMKCAAGIFIADTEYSSTQEGVKWGNVVTKITDTREVPEVHRLINKLQSVHDFSKVSEWPERLELLAIEFSLDEPPILSEAL